MCDCLVALAVSSAVGSTLFAKNSDRPPDEAQVLEWHPPRADRSPVQTTYIEVDPPSRGETIGFVGSRPRWMWGVEHGVNVAGVAIGNETIFTTLDPRPAPPALLGMDLVRLGLERATSAAGAVTVMTSLLERYGQGGSGHAHRDHPYWSSFLVSDTSDAWVVETSGRAWEAEQVTRTRAISNRTTIPSFDAEHRHPRQPVETLVDPRLDASREVLATEPVSIDALKAHLRSHVGKEGYTVCMHAEGTTGDDAEATTASIIAELGPERVPLAHVLLGSPCTSIYVPVAVGRNLGDPPAWERFAALAPEHRERLDVLEAELADGLADDDGWAPHAWRRVDGLLTALGV